MCAGYFPFVLHIYPLLFTIVLSTQRGWPTTWNNPMASFLLVSNCAWPRGRKNRRSMGGKRDLLTAGMLHWIVLLSKVSDPKQVALIKYPFICRIPLSWAPPNHHCKPRCSKGSPAASQSWSTTLSLVFSYPLPRAYLLKIVLYWTPVPIILTGVYCGSLIDFLTFINYPRKWVYKWDDQLSQFAQDWELSQDKVHSVLKSGHS